MLSNAQQCSAMLSIAQHLFLIIVQHCPGLLFFIKFFSSELWLQLAVNCSNDKKISPFSNENRKMQFAQPLRLNSLFSLVFILLPNWLFSTKKKISLPNTVFTSSCKHVWHLLNCMCQAHDIKSSFRASLEKNQGVHWTCKFLKALIRPLE